MLNNLTAYALIVAFSIVGFLIARPFVVDRAVDRAAHTRRFVAWILLTSSAFLTFNFWLHMLTAALVLHVYRRKDDNPLALYCMALLAVPSVAVVLPGLGPIGAIMTLSYYRLVVMFVLLPVAFMIYMSREGKPRWVLPDYLVAFYIFWMMCITFVDSGSPTITVRTTFYYFLDIWVPYYVGSRAIQSLDQIYDIAGTVAATMVALAVIAIWESSRSWLLYEGLPLSWGASTPSFSFFALRGGILRANAGVGGPIPLGYCMMIGLGFAYMVRLRKPGSSGWVVLGLLVIGILATISRGPWVGALAMVCVAALSGPGRIQRGAQLAFVGTFGVAGLLVSPYADSLLKYLPFADSSYGSTVSFRQELITASIEVLSQTPWTGNRAYAEHPLMDSIARGNNGFLDIANTYLTIALPYGLLGLIPFVGVILWMLLKIRRHINGLTRDDTDMLNVGRMLLGVVAGIVITIGTASSSSIIPYLYWAIFGVSVSYVRIARASVTETATAPAIPAAAS